MGIAAKQSTVTDMREFAVVLERIVAALAPERVLCLGSRANKFEGWSIFKTRYEEHIHVTVDLLVVLRSDDRRKPDEAVELISVFNSVTLHVNALVHKLAFVSRTLATGGLFFSNVHNAGILLYERPEAKQMFVPPWNDVNVAETQLRLVAQWEAWFGMAQRAISEAKHSIARGEYVFGVGLLQHAAEYTCVAMLRMVTGYNPPTRNLRKLLDLVGNVSSKATMVFPGSTREEDALFDVLMNAQARARYKEGYTVSAETAGILVARVENLQAVARRLRGVDGGAVSRAWRCRGRYVRHLVRVDRLGITDWLYLAIDHGLADSFKLLKDKHERIYEYPRL